MVRKPDRTWLPMRENGETTGCIVDKNLQSVRHEMRRSALTDLEQESGSLILICLSCEKPAEAGICCPFVRRPAPDSRPARRGRAPGKRPHRRCKSDERRVGKEG